MTPQPDRDTAREFVKQFHESNVWKTIRYRGIRTLKYPMDLWNYQEIIHERGIDWVIETGTRHGGSALFFADQLRLRGSRGNVITIDPFPELEYDLAAHPNIGQVRGDSGSAQLAEAIHSRLPPGRGPLFLILDADHSRNHVLRELNAHVPHLRPGDYLVVEDTIVNGHPVRPDHGPGPREALGEFLAAHPDLLTADEPRNRRFGFSMADEGYFIRN
ncbi:MAG: class I SAM-dependent methyltransferase [Magnetococcales bacterium]|nr:class I SAM-dependent methyltransferase [Magnetococcales bacterium]